VMAWWCASSSKGSEIRRIGSPDIGDHAGVLVHSSDLLHGSIGIELLQLSKTRGWPLDINGLVS